MKFHTTLLFAAILLPIYPAHAPAQQDQQDMKKVQRPSLRRSSEPIDPKLLDRIRKVAEQGDATVQFQLGMMHRLGDGVPQDYAEAEKWIRKSAEQSFPPAQYNLGLMYRNGEGVPKDEAEAEKWIQKAADQDYPPVKKESQEPATSIASLGTPQDMEMLKWIRADAERGNPIAQVNLGLAYHHGDMAPQDHVEAAKWFRRAAEQGEIQGQFQLGSLYYHGVGVPKDYAEAEKWFRKSAEQGHIPAQFNVGLMYLQGQGVPQNYDEAVKWFRTTAETDFASAQFNLGFLYLHGNGVPQNHEEAAKWFRKAAEQGDISAQCMLGAIYGDAEGMAQDNVQAYKWLSLCAATGEGEKQETAINHLAGIIQKMTPQQIEKAERQAIKWIETHAHKIGNNIYLSGGGVDAPVALENPMPPYTEQARAALIRGKVVVACIVRKTGNVDSCEIQRGLGHGLDESAINTIETKWHFQPGKMLNRPVDIYARIEITFKLP